MDPGGVRQVGKGEHRRFYEALKALDENKPRAVGGSFLRELPPLFLDVLFNACTTGNPFFFTNLLEVSIGRDLGVLKGLDLGFEFAMEWLVALCLAKSPT